MILLTAAHLPYLAVYYAGLWQQQTHYQFFPFALVAFLCLFLQRSSSEPGQWTLMSVLLVLCDLVCMSLGLLIDSPWMFAAGLCCSLLAWCRVTSEKGYFRRLTYLALLPLLTLRLPLNMDVELIQLLQQVTTGVASRTLQRFGILHVRMGNVLDFPGKRFLVEEACSGVQSLFTILFIAALLICVQRRSLAHGVFLLLSGVVFAGAMNVLRVISIAWAWDRKGMDLSAGVPHDILGYVCLAVAALLLMSADSFLAFMTGPVPDVRRPGPAGEYRNPLIYLWNKSFAIVPRPALRQETATMTAADAGPWPGSLFWTALSGLVCLVFLTGQVRGLQGESFQPASMQSSSLTILQEESLPGELAGFVRASYQTEVRDTGSELGEFSNLWMFAQAGFKARVACDHPFFGWHPLQQCYVNQGWQIIESDTQANSDAWDAMVVRLSDAAGGRYGVVVYSLFDKSGRPLQPPAVENSGSLIMDRLFRQTAISAMEPMVYQSQVFCETGIPLDDERIQQLVDLHFASRDRLRAQITQAPSTPVSGKPESTDPGPSENPPVQTTP